MNVEKTKVIQIGVGETLGLNYVMIQNWYGQIRLGL